ncbi:YciI family protein [Amycolatopsis pithecellobii]|uniref:YCII-related domain-containing protein n=1 Tax=Amycolatopsis pithecellobii TaxID=664692 RepID=A0A6N7Z411_9PSEU|nr:YciI family protein [Amycolatopsis pithecellobii]MTD53826.1 hypothetical protein [Amycolatopsis pithecellobii]
MYLAVTAYRNGQLPPQPAVEEHWCYLDARYAERRLLCSGPQRAGTGGVLVVRAEDEESARALLDGDPLVRDGHVSYTLTAFRATRAADRAWVDP